VTVNWIYQYTAMSSSYVHRAPLDASWLDDSDDFSNTDTNDSEPGVDNMPLPLWDKVAAPQNYLIWSIAVLVPGTSVYS
jgi:hypothetical protein